MAEQTPATRREGGAATRQTQDADRERVVRPPVDVFESEHSIILYADLPGVSSEGLEISVEGKVLSIEATAKLDTPQDMKVAYAEFRTPRYAREFTLSPELDTQKIDASLKNGLLTLTIPKQEHAKPRKIEVSVS